MDQKVVAETLALRALEWLIAQEDLWSEFLGSTGMDEADVQERATDPEFLAALLDFILINDDWVRRFCEASGYAASDPMLARAALPGGDLPHWT